MLFAQEVFRDPAWYALSPEKSVQALTNHFLPLPEQLVGRRGAAMLPPINVAWMSLGLWTAGGLALLVARIRKVEVVT